MAVPWAYFDTSVLVKQYVAESGSAHARLYCVATACCPAQSPRWRHCRRSTAAGVPVTSPSAMSPPSSRGMTADRAHWELVEVRAPVLEAAEGLIQQAGLRTLDAIHLASALTVQSALGRRIPFVTADSRQREVARARALEVVWVGG